MTRQGAADRLFARFGFAFHNAFARTLPVPADFAAAVGAAAQRLRGGSLSEKLPALRYRLRRDGLRDAHLADAFALYCAALPALPEARVLAAARWIAGGGIAELGATQERREALCLAAFARALHADAVHVLAASEAAAKALADAMSAPLGVLGMQAGCITRGMSAAARRQTYAGAIVCGAHREVAQDYLRDGAGARRVQGALRSTLERVAAGPQAALLPHGLPCALVDEADVVMLDDAPAPLVLAAEADQSRERLMYEQAIELARTLTPDVDFTHGEEGFRLAAAAADRLEAVVAPLGGMWSARQRRMELIGAAVEALHYFQRDVDYRVQGGRVLFPPPEPGAEPSPEDLELRKLVEVKEGCRLSARRDVIARLSLPRFFARYRALGGACAGAAGLEAEFWSMYSLKTARVGTLPGRISVPSRVFTTASARRAAIVAAAQAARSAGARAIVAMRMPAEAEKVHAELKAAEAVAGIVILAAFDAAAPVPGEGPLHLVIGEQPDAARQIERVYRATGAQSCELFLSLEDEAVSGRLSAALVAAARLSAGNAEELPGGVARWIGAAARRAAERTSRAMRAEVTARERTLDDLLAFSGQRE